MFLLRTPFLQNKYNRSFSSKIQYISDIHLEYRDKLPIFPQVANNLALLGDIGNPFKKNYVEFLKYASNNWDKVFLLSGNHEYWQYNYNHNDVDNKIRDITRQFNNIFFLNNDKYDLENYTILGSTLWTKINKKPLMIMGDDLYVRSNNKLITFDELNNMHDISQKWLSDNISKSDKPLLVLTHHLPSYELIIPKYKTGFFSPYQDRFASDLNHLIKDPVKYWLCGHSHCNIQIKINNINCGINAYGYTKDSNKKKPEIYTKFIELD